MFWTFKHVRRRREFWEHRFGCSQGLSVQPDNNILGRIDRYGHVVSGGSIAVPGSGRTGASSISASYKDAPSTAGRVGGYQSSSPIFRRVVLSVCLCLFSVFLLFLFAFFVLTAF